MGRIYKDARGFLFTDTDFNSLDCCFALPMPDDILLDRILERGCIMMIVLIKLISSCKVSNQITLQNYGNPNLAEIVDFYPIFWTYAV